MYILLNALVTMAQFKLKINKAWSLIWVEPGLFSDFGEIKVWYKHFIIWRHCYLCNFIHIVHWSMYILVYNMESINLLTGHINYWFTNDARMILSLLAWHYHSQHDVISTYNIITPQIILSFYELCQSSLITIISLNSWWYQSQDTINSRMHAIIDYYINHLPR